MIEHRLFFFISTNWKGRSVQDHGIVVQLIVHTTTAIGCFAVLHAGEISNNESAGNRLGFLGGPDPPNLPQCVAVAEIPLGASGASALMLRP
jgi:hypothetical protein